MKDCLEVPYDEGRIATFKLINNKGIFDCPELIPYSLVWQVGKRFDEVVATDVPFVSLLAPAIITSADRHDTGTTFHLEFPSAQK